MLIDYARSGGFYNDFPANLSPELSHLLPNPLIAPAPQPSIGGFREDS